MRGLGFLWWLMRILLDESLPHDLAALILGHEVSTVRDEGWASSKNGKLLALASTKFDAFITADRNLEFQQNLAKLPQCQKLAILDACPSFISDSRHLMVKDQCRKVVWQRLIKQDAHRPPGIPWPSQERLLPVHA